MQRDIRSEWDTELAAVNMLAHALAYARRGWAVLPIWWPSFAGVCACGDLRCSAVAKHPLVKGGAGTATLDAERIRKWWGRWPHANIAIATGQISNLTVLDIDVDHGGMDAFRTMRKRYGDPEVTVVSVTGSGGRHILWRFEPGHRCRQSVRAGIDVRATGGYVVAPPSLHSSGDRYRWHEEGHPRDTKVSEAPGWARPLLSGVGGGNGHRSEPLPTGPIVEGTRNRSLFRLACRWRRLGADDEEVANRAHLTNTKLCEPPLDNGEVEKIVGSVLRYPRGT